EHALLNSEADPAAPECADRSSLHGGVHGSTVEIDQPARSRSTRCPATRRASETFQTGPLRVTPMTADRSDEPLPALLVCLTVVTGLVDAFSYLRLGHVFGANVTGNVVFLGFALAGVGRSQ